MFGRRRGPGPGSIYSFLITWLVLSMFLPLYELGGLLTALGLGLGVAFLFGRASGRRAEKKKKRAEKQKQEKPEVKKVDTTVRNIGETPAPKQEEKKSYGPEVDPILQEGNRALSEMGRLYMSIRDPEIRIKINEILRITDQIVQDASEDPSDIPKIRKFNAYDRMSSQGIEGENIDKSMQSITEMLDAAIAAYKKQLDSLFANQALDIETDIAVMNAMLAREGLTDKKDFDIREDTQDSTQPSEGQVLQSSGGKF